jgi:hypothetical protein
MVNLPHDQIDRLQRGKSLQSARASCHQEHARLAPESKRKMPQEERQRGYGDGTAGIEITLDRHSFEQGMGHWFSF